MCVFKFLLSEQGKGSGVGSDRGLVTGTSAETGMGTRIGTGTGLKEAGERNVNKLVDLGRNESGESYEGIVLLNCCCHAMLCHEDD